MTTLKVLTLNVWAIHFAQKIRERLGYIAEELKQYDIVGLQEVWSREDYDFLAERLQYHLPHSHHVKRGIYGSGLCVFSRHPIVSVYTHPFTINGSIAEIADGEILVAKAIMFSCIQTAAGNIAFYNTHTNPKNRDIQLFEIFQFVERTRGSMPVILLGDFNTKPTHPAYSILTECLRLQDVYTDDPVDTCDLKSNIYTIKKMIGKPKRIDFILFSPSKEIELKHHQLALSGPIPGESFPFSDHEGVEAVFVHRDKPGRLPRLELSDKAILVFTELSERLEAKKREHQITSTHSAFPALALIILCTLILTLCKPTLYMTLASINLQWLVSALIGLIGALSIVCAVNMFNKVRISNHYEAGLQEIWTLLKFQQSLAIENHTS